MAPVQFYWISNSVSKIKNCESYDIMQLKFRLIISNYLSRLRRWFWKSNIYDHSYINEVKCENESIKKLLFNLYIRSQRTLQKKISSAVKWLFADDLIKYVLFNVWLFILKWKQYLQVSLWNGFTLHFPESNCVYISRCLAKSIIKKQIQE